jgi:hypothetical protein
MLGSTHERIAQSIISELKIQEKRHIGLLMVGSKNPDSWDNFPHRARYSLNLN